MLAFEKEIINSEEIKVENQEKYEKEKKRDYKNDARKAPSENCIISSSIFEIHFNDARNSNRRLVKLSEN
jgi:hypothetical protein